MFRCFSFLKLIALICFLSIPSFCFADSYYDFGKDLGNAIGNAMGNAPYRGDIDKSFYKDEKFDFSTLKRFLLLTSVPQHCHPFVDDQFIIQKCNQAIQKELGKKYHIKTSDEVAEQYWKLHPDTVNLPPEQGRQRFIQFVSKTIDAAIFVNIQAYNTYGRACNAHLSFYITPITADMSVFNYTESRLNVENRSKAKTLGIILDHFSEKFKESVPATK